jgi:hypothetical protein
MLWLLSWRASWLRRPGTLTSPTAWLAHVRVCSQTYGKQRIQRSRFKENYWLYRVNFVFGTTHNFLCPREHPQPIAAVNVIPVSGAGGIRYRLVRGSCVDAAECAVYARWANGRFNAQTYWITALYSSD